MSDRPIKALPAKAPHPLALGFYRCALVFYPSRLRLEYREQMLQTLRDAYQNRSLTAARFWINAYADLLKSSCAERLHMLSDILVRRPLIYHTLTLAILLTLIGGAAAMTMQQMLRRGADQPQVDMAEWYAGEISAGEAPGDVVPPGYVDLERSLQPFVIFYNDQGQPTTGTGYLDQKLPSPPPGVLAYVREHGLEKVTWQPQRGVRMASVVKRIYGKTPGFILAARSLREVEQQESLLRRMTLGIWLAVMALLFGGAALLKRAEGMKQASA